MGATKTKSGWRIGEAAPLETKGESADAGTGQRKKKRLKDHLERQKQGKQQWYGSFGRDSRSHGAPRHIGTKDYLERKGEAHQSLNKSAQTLVDLQRIHLNKEKRKGAKKWTFIYALTDPKSGEIRYIGKSNSPKMRYEQHLSESSNQAKYLWIQDLKSEGLKPGLLIMERVPHKAWQRFERYHIDNYRQQGYKLFNIGDGGEQSWAEGTPLSARLRQSNAGEPKRR